MMHPCYIVPMNIILFEEDELGKSLPKRDERVVHLTKVLRKKAGDTFDAGLLGGKRGRGRIEAIEEDASLSFSLELDEAVEALFPLRIAVGFPRPIQLRRLLRDLSNLGVAAIDLVGTELGEKSYRDTRLLDDGGARAALIEGAVQARSTWLPSLASYRSLDAWLDSKPWPQSGSVLVAPDNVRPQCSFSSFIPPSDSRGDFVLAIGSERGWSDRERFLLEDAGFARVSMGSRALRTETACVAAVVLALEKSGALG
ncbi:16S rRNA (uracil(1498)-N(3))-methyltransferase [Treponema sp.]